MKIALDQAQRSFILDLIHHMAIQAGQMGDRELYRQLMRTANKFDGQRVLCELKPIEMNMVSDVCKSTNQTLELDVIPKLEASEKKDKEESLKKAREMLLLSLTIMGKIEDKLNDKPPG